MKAAIDAIQAVNTDSKIVVSIAHLHFGFLLGMRDRGLTWDILGLDWYEEHGPFSELLDPLKELFPEYDYIICESNIRAGERGERFAGRTVAVAVRRHGRLLSGRQGDRLPLL